MTKEVMLGTELFKEDIQNEPDVEITPMGGEDGAPTYTLAMFDPDAPSRNDPKYGPFRHWVVSEPNPPVIHNQNQNQRRLILLIYYHSLSVFSLSFVPRAVADVNFLLGIRPEATYAEPSLLCC